MYYWLWSLVHRRWFLIQCDIFWYILMYEVDLIISINLAMMGSIPKNKTANIMNGLIYYNFVTFFVKFFIMNWLINCIVLIEWAQNIIMNEWNQLTNAAMFVALDQLLLLLCIVLLSETDTLIRSKKVSQFLSNLKEHGPIIYMIPAVYTSMVFTTVNPTVKTLDLC